MNYSYRLFQAGDVTTREKQRSWGLNLHAHEARCSIAAVCNRGLSTKALNMQNVNLRYHERHVRRKSPVYPNLTGLVVLKDIDWSIRQRDCWHFQGSDCTLVTVLRHLQL